ncbi:MAG: VirB4 family type IV secretion system protein [Candidatus Acidiferrales bacterium]
MPLTAEGYERSLSAPPLCEQFRVRDLLDNVAVQIDGSLAAGYEALGIQSYYASDEGRNRLKGLLEALVRALPERSMRMQVRFEISEGAGDSISRYVRERRGESPVLRDLDRLRVELLRSREAAGFYLEHFLHLYFIWNPRIHHESPDLEWKRKMKSSGTFRVSARTCMERSRQEHEELIAEFNSLLAGVEATLGATGMSIRRMTHEDIFLETKRALHPLGNDTVPYRAAGGSLWRESARSQMANVNMEDEQDDYLKIGGLLYSWISLKDLPDATFPGILRELVVMDFPLVINAEVTLPDQSKSIKQYKSRLRKMLAAQKDFHGGFRINVDAQVAEHQLVRVLQDLISSSLKACQMSLIVTVRSSKPARNRPEREEAERILADRRQRVLHAIARMNGGRGIPETLAQKRLFFSGLPAMGGKNRRELDLLTLNAADLLPVEVPWRGTPHSPVMLWETPYRQLVPFSPFDASLGDANMLIMAKSGGGKTFMAQLFLLMMARANPRISIIERGDSYQSLVELMGGRIIDMKLDGTETLNPWDLPAGETAPRKEKIAFLKNLTRHMIGDSPGSDNSLVDNLLSDAIARTYKRCAIRYSNPIPTFNDLREELAQWRDEERMQRTIDEARLAAIKLRSWTGEKGIYAKLFDAHTTMRLDSNWLFFNVEGLSSEAKLETAMSMLIANAVASRSGGKTGQPSITVLDECWFLLDSPTLAPEVVQLFRTARKRNSSVWGISQTVEDFVGTEFQPREHGPGILKNASTKIIGQQPGDMTPLVNHLYLNPVALNEVKRFSAPRKGESADALLVLGEKAETTQTIRIVPTAVDYWICTTFPRERRYRAWVLEKFAGRPLVETYQELARTFPRGLAEVPALPEEVSGAVTGEVR